MRRRLGGRSAPRVRGEDRLGALQDDVLQHVLSFLPSREAVRTCVLARRWRHQWKSVPALRITGVDAFESARHLNGFVNHLIVLRERTPLHACEIEAYEEYEEDGEWPQDDDIEREERSRYTDLWIRYGLSCDARVLRLSDHDPHNLNPKIDNIENVVLDTPIASRHLTTLDLDGVVFSSNYSLDFSSCPNLGTLKMNRCSFILIGYHHDHVNISSQSVRCLSITECFFRRRDTKCALVSFPSLLYLELKDGSGLIPAFESMPSLLTASIKLEDNTFEDINNKDGSLLFGLLSNSTKLTNLEVQIAEPQAFAFRKKLKRCTTFSKLRTLSLNDWCVEPDFGPLIYFLQRSPGLEKLCLRLSKPYQHGEKTDGIFDSTEPFLASKHLKVVEIKCRAKDERVHKILKVLSSYGVLAAQINIKERTRSSQGVYYDSDRSDNSYSDPGTISA